MHGLSGQLAAIRKAGDPLTLADLARKPIPPEKNAATYLRQAEADVTAIQNEMQHWITLKNCPILAVFRARNNRCPRKCIRP